MGQEIACTVQIDGKTFRGQALLESNEIIFRGEHRLKIPITSILAITAKDGELHVRHASGEAIFHLGAAAEKWRERILHPKSVVEKLGVKPGERVALKGGFAKDFLADLKQLGASVAKGDGMDGAAVIFAAAERKSELAAVKKCARQLQGAAALWIVYPKGQKTITEMDVISAGRLAGLKDVKVVSFSATHTALKFVLPKSAR
jgi:hypothetical protein